MVHSIYGLVFKWPSKNPTTVTIKKPDYSDHSNTGHSNYGTIEFPDTFASGFGMVFNHPIYGLFLKWFASLDRLIRNENILVTLFIYRTV